MPFISLGLSSDAWFTHRVFGSWPGSEAWHIRLFSDLLQVSATNSFYRFLFSIPDVLTFTCFAKFQGPFCSWCPSTSSFLNLECHLPLLHPLRQLDTNQRLNSTGKSFWNKLLKDSVLCVCVCVYVLNILYDICDFFRVYMCVWMHVNTCPKCVCLCVVYITGGSLVAKSHPTLMTPWIIACQAPLSVGFPRQEYWSGLPFPSPGDLPNSDWTCCISCIGRQIFYHWATRNVYGIIQR